MGAGIRPGGGANRWSFWQVVVFWWLLLLAIQQAQRLSLLSGAVKRDAPSAGVLLTTLLTGLRADLITAGLGMAAVVLIAGVAGTLVAVARRVAGGGGLTRGIYVRALGVVAAATAIVYFAILTLDLGYYRYSERRLDPVFFEFVADFLDQARAGAALDSQAGRQTAAEAQDLRRWILPVAGYVVLQVGAITGLWLLFTRWITPALASWQAAAPRLTAVLLSLVIAAGAWGLHPDGPDSVQSAGISHSTYYALAQNPLWYVGTAVRPRGKRQRQVNVPPSVLAAMPEARAIGIAQTTLAPGATFLDARYPLVRVVEDRAHRLARRPNVLLLFVEALDRRFLDRTEAGVRVTPFLDSLVEDSVRFEQFLSNGAQTFHGLFATLCSSLPRHGTAATKARYANDYLCLPTLLQRAGYRTEMVIGQNRDRNHSRLGLFMARNGLDVLIDETSFPAGAPRMGLGMTDGALFDRILAEIRRLRGTDRRYFLSALTTGTHHPFVVPDAHPDVAALRAHPDRYLAALRYVDFELERFFTALRRDGLLSDTVVLILGDHGRHETQGGTHLQRAAGHFMSPLVLWVDPSMRSPGSYRPRAVRGAASQVDVTPTVLGLAGLTPRLSPFVGADLSCALATDCLPDRIVYFSDVYDNLVGMADRDGFWFYAPHAHTLERIDLDLRRGDRWPASDPAVAARVERILALYVSSNMLIERNRLWSWKEFGSRL